MKIVTDTARRTERASALDAALSGGARRLRAISSGLLMYGVLLSCVGVGMYLFGVVFALPRHLLGNPPVLLHFNEWIVWYSGVPLVCGCALAGLDLLVLMGRKRTTVQDVRDEPVIAPRIVVALTAYNDEESIAEAVTDFLGQPGVFEVIVVSNNSCDRTIARALGAGATVYDEPDQGYGRCVYRCLTEAVSREADLVVLSEGDRTFRARDIDKLLAYVAHADIVNGTRTVERLRARSTQLSTFMYYGNIFVGKLLEAKHLGRSTITDVGTTYKMCRRAALARLLPLLQPSVNLEFNAHFLDMALANKFDVVECPITFHPRVGQSKGGNVGNARALKVGLRMIFGIAVRWTALTA